MVKHKCGICGDVLIPAYTEFGQPIFICPNFKGRTTKYGINLYTLEIWCDLKPQQPQVQPPPFRPQNKQQETAYNLSIQTDGMRQAFNELVGKRYYEMLKNATYGMISEKDLLQQTNLALTMGLPLLELPKLFNCAVKLGRALGLEPKKAIEAISKGIGRKSRKILDNIGITLKPNLKGQEWTKEAIKEVIAKGSELPEPTETEIKANQTKANEINSLIQFGKQLRS